MSNRPTKPIAPRTRTAPAANADAARKYPSSAQLRFWNGSRRITSDSRRACWARSSGIRICTQPTSVPGSLKRRA